LSKTSPSTDRRRKARREAEEEKSALLEEAPVDIVHTDLKGRITYVNQRFESDSGYSRREVIGKKNGFQLEWFPVGTLKFLAERMVARLEGSPASTGKPSSNARTDDASGLN